MYASGTHKVRGLRQLCAPLSLSLGGNFNLPHVETIEYCMFVDAKQVRLVIWKCKDVVSADLLSGLNDLFVKAWVEGCDSQVIFSSRKKLL